MILVPRAVLRSLLVVVPVAAAAVAYAAPPPGMPGPAPQARPEGYGAAAENRACEACHADIAVEWRGSLHHRAWDDPAVDEVIVAEGVLPPAAP